MIHSADTVRQIIDAIDALADSVRAVHSMAQGGEYEDVSLWEVDRIVRKLREQTAQIDGSTTP